MECLLDTDTDLVQRWFCDPLRTFEVDVGSNSGVFLTNLARRFPDRTCVGIELRANLCTLARTRARRNKLANVAVVNVEAYEFFRRVVPTSSVSAIHVYFPTPYPGALNLEKRLLRREFFNEAQRVMMGGGNLRILTDHKAYYDEICRHVSNEYWWPVDWQSPFLEKQDGYFVGTPMEAKHRAAGKEILWLQLIRKHRVTAINLHESGYDRRGNVRVAVVKKASL